MSIKKLQWDSEFFGFEVGDALVSHSDDVMADDMMPYRFVQIRSLTATDFKSENHSQTYEETKVIFAKKMSGEKFNTEYDVNDADIHSINASELYSLAYESGKYSRYKMDANIPLEKFEELYRLWVDNSLNKMFADKLFYIKEGDRVQGFVTLKKAATVAKIGLIAVDPAIQGKGLGSRLLKAAEQYCTENGIEKLEIPTQLENGPACNFYTKMGYAIQEKINIRHYWRK